MVVSSDVVVRLLEVVNIEVLVDEVFLAADGSDPGLDFLFLLNWLDWFSGFLGGLSFGLLGLGLLRSLCLLGSLGGFLFRLLLRDFLGSFNSHSSNRSSKVFNDIRNQFVSYFSNWSRRSYNYIGNKFLDNRRRRRRSNLSGLGLLFSLRLSDSSGFLFG